MFDLPTQDDGVNLRPLVGAIIYIRVSTKEQTENLSLPTQLRVCEEYCRREGFEILERFKEEGESAKTTDRRELQRMLAYCRSNKGRVHFLVVFNLTRFARDKYDHFALRSHLKSLGISLRSATEPIDDTSTGKLMEGVLAAFAQFDNDVRSDRTRAGMQEALRRGRWTFLGPLGYLNSARAIRQSLIPDPERAAIVRQVFNQYATGTYRKQKILRKATKWGLTNRRVIRSPQKRSGCCCAIACTLASSTSRSLASVISVATSLRPVQGHILEGPDASPIARHRTHNGQQLVALKLLLEVSLRKLTP